VALLIRTAPSRDAPTSRLPPRQAHRDRRWFRATNNRRTRAPSIGSTRTLRLGRLGHACCSLAWRRPHPVACRDPVPPRQGPAVRFKLSLRSRLLPRSRWGRPPYPPAQPDAPRKMRLSDFCNRLHFTSTPRTARFPAASLCATPCGGAIERRLVLGHGPGGDEVGAPTPLARRANQVELRLTANLQLQPLPQLVPWIFEIGLSARSFPIRYTRPSAVLAGLRSTAPLRRTSRSGRFQPRTEHATKPLTSSSTIQGGSDLDRRP
jgi:hypothetical protein